MVYFTPVDLWVHAGVAGFGDAYIQSELEHLGYYSFPQGAEVVVDVGGHIGIYSRYAARHARQVIYVEPHPENVTLARQNFAWWNLTNVEIIQGALTYEADAEFHPYVPDNNTGGSQILPRGATPFANACQHGPPIRVETVTLETIRQRFGLDRIDILKLDCEGSEYSILCQADLTPVTYIVGEWHKVPGQPLFDEFCRRQLPEWELETSGKLDAPLGYFLLHRK